MARRATGALAADRAPDAAEVAVGPWRLQIERALIGRRWAGDVVAQLARRLAAVGTAAHAGVQTEVILVGT